MTEHEVTEAVDTWEMLRGNMEQTTGAIPRTKDDGERRGNIQPMSVEEFTDMICEGLPEGSKKFRRVLEEVWRLHLKKGKDYGDKDDVFQNIRGSEDIGIPAWKGCWNRNLDKVRRINKFCRDGVLENESVEDGWLDNAGYSIICLVIFREAEELLGKKKACAALRGEGK